MEWGFGEFKYHRPGLSKLDSKKILSMKDFFQNEGEFKWLSIYKYEDGEYVICLDQLGEAYYEGSLDNNRFGKEIRLEKKTHIIHFIEQYILNDKYFTK